MIRTRDIMGRYLARSFAFALIGFMVALVGIILLFDIIELLRRGGDVGGLPTTLITYLAVLKVPGNMMRVAPFTVLFAALFVLTIFMKRQEIVVLRTAGASLWQILGPFFIVAFIYGAMLVTIIHPLSAATEERFERFESRYLNKRGHMVALLDEGMWLRQGTGGGGYMLIHAGTVRLPDWRLQDVVVLFFADDHRFLSRLDAPLGALTDRTLELPTATLSVAGQLPEVRADYRLDTALALTDIEESFATPEIVSFWQMPGLIRKLRVTGFPVARLTVSYGALMMLPLLCLGLVMAAAAVTIRPPRQGGQVRLAVFGITVGFVIFFLSNFLQALGASGQIPVILAACAPALITLAGGAISLLALEDG